MSHIGSVECYISRWIKSFPSLLCASAVVRQTEAPAKNVKERKQPSLSLEGFLDGFDVSAAALSCLAVEYVVVAALVNAHNSRFLFSIFN